MKCRRSIIALLACSVIGTAGCGGGSSTTDPPTNLKILAWNNLGMHCYNPDFSDIAILPPYNTLWAQIVGVGGSPQIVTSGIRVEYSFPENTYSAKQLPNPATPDKTNFWYFVKPLFGASPAVNVGLTGLGLSGVMTLKGDHFEAEGIPLTEYRDQDATPGGSPQTWTRYPFQLALIVVKDAASGAELARERVVAPVSSELSCAECHSDDGDATMRDPAVTPTGSVGQNILAKHDALNPGVGPLLSNRPVLCANCHGSNALNMAGRPGVNSLSAAMHGHHNSTTVSDITPDIDGCYKCHPGPVTKCLRDVMTTKGEVRDCISCHGTIEQVATNPNPWLNEPRCDNAACHGARRPDIRLDQPLYRNSRGHQGIYCAGCHDSPHAIAPSREANDSLKLVDLQGSPATLSKCTVCHATSPGGTFSHGID
jgi:hypothetical protein